MLPEVRPNNDRIKYIQIFNFENQTNFKNDLLKYSYFQLETLNLIKNKLNIKLIKAFIIE